MMLICNTWQGTGWSPIIWSALNAVIIEIMNNTQPGQVFKSPTGKNVERQNIDSYVEDSNLSVNEEGVKEFNKRTDEKLSLEEASKNAYQSYKKYVFLSGGKLALHKCKYYYR